MSLPEQRRLGGQRRELNTTYINSSYINGFPNVNKRLDEIAEYIESSDIAETFYLHRAPVCEELARRAFQAVASNPRITTIQFDVSPYVAIRDLMPWIASRGTLTHMTSLERVILHLFGDLSVQDCDALFPLLVTCTSLQELRVSFFIIDSRCDDDVMSALARFLAGSSLVSFILICDHMILSQAGFNSLCDGVAKSTLRKLTLECKVSGEANLETVAESLARAIDNSSLEEVVIGDKGLCSALLRTTCVRNLDFAFSQTGNKASHLRINRKWKPLLIANSPMGLWPHILAKASASPETSYGPVGILFYLLREKPDLVSAP